MWAVYWIRTEESRAERLAAALDELRREYGGLVEGHGALTEEVAALKGQVGRPSCSLVVLVYRFASVMSNLDAVMPLCVA